MAIAKQSVGGVGVSRGYKPRTQTRVVVKREPSKLVKAIQSVRAAVRDLREFVADEIVYATIDTARVLNYVEYQLHLTPRRRNPVRFAEQERAVLDWDTDAGMTLEQ